LKVIIFAIILTSFGEGLYQLITPLYLNDQGISLFTIGFIFSVAAFAMLTIKILFGAYSDIKGRKFVFAASFLLQFISNSIFPFAKGFVEIAIVKTLFDFGSSIKDALKSTVIYENATQIFAKITAWISGIVHLMWALASFGAAFIVSIFAFDNTFLLIGVLELIGFLVIIFFYKEKKETHKQNRLQLREMYSLNVRRNMWVLMCAISLFYIGIFLSHGFAQPLYFQAKYNLSTAEIGLIIGLHRLSLALPLFYTGTIMHKIEAKKAYVLSALLVSIFLLAMGMVNNLIIAVPLWLLHDVFGGSINVPTQEILIQKNARDNQRGKDVNTMYLLLGFAAIVTPSLSGALIMVSWDLIFLVGGTLTTIAALIIAVFYKEIDKK
jgi:MFS family permease